MARIPNPAVTYTSVNSMVNEEQSFKFPAEFLNFIEVSGLPQHILSLKVGMSVMLLRFIKPPRADEWNKMHHTFLQQKYSTEIQ